MVFHLKKSKRKKMNNDGSAMIMIIVVILFVTLLATTLLYISSMNYQIKQTDYRNKLSFYSGETYLETMKAALMQDVSEAATKAYNDTMSQFISLPTDNMRRAVYYENFMDNLIATNGIWVTRGAWSSWANGLAGESVFTFTEDQNPGNGSVNDTWSDIVDARNKTNGYLVLRGICVSYTNSDGYMTQITTDIYVQAPQFDWSVDSAIMSGGAPDSDLLEKKEIDISDCVKYVNWEKQ